LRAHNSRVDQAQRGARSGMGMSGHRAGKPPKGAGWEPLTRPDAHPVPAPASIRSPLRDI
jgi:hypothetical protein